MQRQWPCLLKSRSRSDGAVDDAQPDLAAVQLNRGLCLIQLSRAESEVSAELGLNYAQQAQFAFLAAKRYAPSIERPGIRLESTATWVTELQVRIAEEAEEQNEMEAQMEAVAGFVHAGLARGAAGLASASG